MANKPNQKKMKNTSTVKPVKKAPDEKSLKDVNQPWLSMKSGLILVGLASLGMAVLTAWQVTPEKGLLQGVLYGLLFGVLIWVIFWGFYFIRRILR